MNNEIFTDEFFENMVSISLFLNSETVLKGESAEDLVAYLKSLRLEPTEGTPIIDTESELRYGGNQGYCVQFQNGEMVLFRASGATLTINSRNYYVVDKDGKPISEFSKTLWNFFYPDA